MKPDTSHDAVNEILPWYATGTVTGVERDMVASHLRDCAVCRDELVFLQDVHAAAADIAADTPPVPDSLAKTMAAIDAWEESRPAGVWTRVTRFVDSLLGPTPGFARAAFAAQFALILVLGGLLLMRPGEAELTTLSGGNATAGGPRVTMVFQPEATESAIRQTLLDANATVVSGPSALGVYVVELTMTPGDDERVDAAIAQLRAQAAVRFVERQP